MSAYDPWQTFNAPSASPEFLLLTQGDHLTTSKHNSRRNHPDPPRDSPKTAYWMRAVQCGAADLSQDMYRPANVPGS